MSVRVVTAPERLEHTSDITIFLAGGITDCPDWQSDMIQALKEDVPEETPVKLLNPRRPNFNVRDPNASDEQVEWEAAALKGADAISFWFPDDTLCPITLYELGGWSRTSKPIFVSTSPRYKRRFDVVKQTSIYRPDVVVHSGLAPLISEIAGWVA